MLYFRASQVVVFLQWSSNNVPFGDNTAPEPGSQAAAAQTQSIPTMGLQPGEDILGPRERERRNYAGE